MRVSIKSSSSEWLESLSGGVCQKYHVFVLCNKIVSLVLLPVSSEVEISWKEVLMGRIALSVEDDDAVYILLQVAFQEVANEFELIRALDGEHALARLRKLHPHENAPRPDLILLDLNLPKMDGSEVLEAIRRDELLNSIPVVIFTSSRLDSDRAKCLALGARDFISKPNDFDSFVESVKAACAHAG